MQYYVPQFIESESKIIGPLSLKQFFLMAGPLIFVIVLYLIFKNIFISFLLGILLVGGGAAFALFKYQGQDLVSIFSYGISYFLNPKEYIWFKKGQEMVSLKEVEKVIEKKEKTVPQRRAEESKLKKMAWMLEAKKNETEEEFRPENNIIKNKE